VVTEVRGLDGRWRTHPTTAALTGLGVLTVASYVYGAQPHFPYIFPFGAFGEVALIQALLFGSSAWIVLTGRVSRPAFIVIVVVAILCRGLLVVRPPYFSTDVYRYVWDGRVQAAGINPYRYVPSDPALAPLRDAAIYPYINRRDYAHTIYPPLAQVIFLGATRIAPSVTGIKAAMAGFEAVTVWLLCALLARLGLPRGRVLLYAWHPLVVWQYAGDGHVDAAAITFIVAALFAHVRRRETLTGVALGCAALVKFYPALLFPALYRRWGWKMPAAMIATFVAGYLPYLGVGAGVIGFLPIYAGEEGIFSGRRFFLLNVARRLGAAVPVPVYIGIALAALLIIAYRVLREQNRTLLSDLQAGAALSTAFVVLFSTHYLWYFGWVVPFLCFAPTVALLYLTGVPPFLFSALGLRPFVGLGGEMPSFDVVLYLPFALLGLGGVLARRGWRTPWARNDGRSAAWALAPAARAAGGGEQGGGNETG
jgi:alpha-1,6-mannosyltransferase